MIVRDSGALRTRLEALPRAACANHCQVAPPGDEFLSSGVPGAPVAERPSQAAPARPAAVSSPGPQPPPVILPLLEAPSLALEAPGPRSGIDLSNIDPSVRPQDNFYQHAVGGWIARNPIPADKPRWGNFGVLAERNQKALHEILGELAARTDFPPGSNEQKLSDFYASGMDQAAIDAAGSKPLIPVFERIDSISNLIDLQDTLAWLHGQGLPGLFGMGASPDLKNSTMNIAAAGQGGLGLPERDFYFETDERSVKVRAAYQEHVQKMFELLGDSSQAAAAKAATVMRVETALAEVSVKKEDLRDPDKRYNIKDRAQLAEMTPHFDWPRYFKGRGVEGLESINIATPGYFEGMDRLLSEVPLGDWKTYLSWQTLNGAAGLLSSDFEKQNFEFKGKVLTGVTEMPPRWKKIVGLTDGTLGEALGQEFVKRNFPPESKARVREMVHNLEAALKDSLTTLPWMSDATREQALAKLSTFVDKIGYPDKWKDYSALDVQRGSFLQNVLAANRWEVQEDLARIGKPVDRSEWGMTPATVNAYYYSPLNEIVFPAGILQPPFFDAAADDAVNYGAIGMVMGHELTHGFDDQGSKFDARGNLNNWWTEADRDRFQQRADGIIAQADAFEVQPGLRLNGQLVQGESLADQGGIELAYRAFQKSMQGKERRVIDGFTPEQRFFLGFAQVWAENARPEYERLVTKTDPHPVDRFRVNNTLANFPPFYEAFGVKPGDPLHRTPEQRVSLWWQAAER